MGQDRVVRFSDDGGRVLYWTPGNINTETLQLIAEKAIRILSHRLPLFVAESEAEARSGPPLNLEASFFPDEALRAIQDACRVELDSRRNRVLNADLELFDKQDLEMLGRRIASVLVERRSKSKRK